MFNIIIKRVI